MELQTWEIRYRAKYLAQHRARNQALEQHMAGEDHAPKRVDVAVATVEAGLDAALSLVDDAEVERISVARGLGFTDCRDGVPRTLCPFDYDDAYMAWHAGYEQALPKAVDHDPATRERGYRPPVPGAARVPRPGRDFT